MRVWKVVQLGRGGTNIVISCAQCPYSCVSVHILTLTIMLQYNIFSSPNGLSQWTSNSMKKPCRSSTFNVKRCVHTKNTHKLECRSEKQKGKQLHHQHHQPCCCWFERWIGLDVTGLSICLIERRRRDQNDRMRRETMTL